MSSENQLWFKDFQPSHSGVQMDFLPRKFQSFYNTADRRRGNLGKTLYSMQSRQTLYVQAGQWL